MAARDAFESAREQFEDAGIGVYVAIAQMNLGLVQLDQGDLAGALPLLRAGLAGASTGHRGVATLNLGVARVIEGDPARPELFELRITDRLDLPCIRLRLAAIEAQECPRHGKDGEGSRRRNRARTSKPPSPAAPSLLILWRWVIQTEQQQVHR